MKKFLCYDTNDAVSGKVPVNTKTGVLTPIIDTNFFVRFYDDASENILADKTFDEILSAYRKGDNITARYKYDGTSYLNLRLEWISDTGTTSPRNNCAVFSCLILEAGGDVNTFPVFIIQMFGNGVCIPHQITLQGTI